MAQIDFPASGLSGASRINHELKYFINSAPAHINLENLDDSNIFKWTVNMNGIQGTMYEGEKFKLQFEFTDNYPQVSPIVKFVSGHVPVHPHIYSNGHICLEILYAGYRPEMTIVYICLCVTQMLNKNKNKVVPRGDSYYSLRRVDRNPKNTSWIYEDEY
ncbi:Ubiquitin-conjugating enzyme [Oopsacas minuta]|uniref:Ubiquitin-conjugating enzyme n=1 Tax=Oopsacas minuta TaxID=111878 RepID=A0AAV7JT20_9METZ|nr:Ubiquitin-conjugating enzyme [Oopsacas minuta]